MPKDELRFYLEIRSCCRPLLGLYFEIDPPHSLGDIQEKKPHKDAGIYLRLFINFLVNFGFMLKLFVLHVLRFSSYWGSHINMGVASRVESGGLFILSKFNAHKYFSHKCAISGYK
jgi:hypothetical protein